MTEQVAGDAMVFIHHIKDGFLFLADSTDFGEAAGVKVAPGRRIDGAGHRAFEYDPFAAGVFIDYRHGCHQRLSIGVQRAGKDFAGRPFFDDFSQVHDRYPVADVMDDAEVVGDEQIGQFEVFLQFFQQIDDLRLDGDVQGGDRFVADDEPGMHRQSASDADPLPLASAELVRIGVHAHVEDAYSLQQMADLVPQEF